MTKLKIISSNGTEFYLTKSTFTYQELRTMIDQMKFSTIEITMCNETPLNDSQVLEREIRAGREQ